ncbi:MAG TPA: hypothetical protein DCS93_29210 [Microscillaceae bacterium]|nr:hypothetical protein [Microscillaceae bacterium]
MKLLFNKEKNFFIILFTLLSSLSYAQGWVGGVIGTNEVLYPVSSNLTLNDIRIGVGTDLPTTQFHTTGTLRFENLAQSSTNNRLLSIDSDGNVAWRDANSLFNNSNNWLLTGNNATSTDFIGTLNDQDFRVRTNNQRRFVIEKNGRAKFIADGSTYGSVASLTQVSIFTDESTSYNSNRHFDGLYIFNSNASANTNKGVSIVLGGRMATPGPGYWSTCAISAVVDDQASTGETVDLVFQHENPANQYVENMRLTWDGRLGVGTNNPTARLHTKDSGVRFEGLPSGTGKNLVVDNDGNVYVSNVTSRTTSTNQEGTEQISELKNRVESLEKLVKQLLDEKNNKSESNDVTLFQNIPNPTKGSTSIPYLIPSDYSLINATLKITSSTGKAIHEIAINKKGLSQVEVPSDVFPANGVYFYSIIVNGKIYDTKRIIIQR